MKIIKLSEEKRKRKKKQIISLSEEKRKRKKKQRSSAELHEVLPVLRLFKDKKPEKKEIKTVSEKSQDELEPIISIPINSPMSDE